MIFFLLHQERKIAGAAPDGTLAKPILPEPASPAITVKPNGGPRLISTDGMAELIYPLSLQPRRRTTLSLMLSPHPLIALFVAPLVLRVGFEPTLLRS